MGKKRKKHGPRRKRMKRPARLASAKATQFVQNYSGKNIIRGYCKWYGVDERCALIELPLLGYQLTEEQKTKAEKSVEARTKANVRRKQRKQERKNEALPDWFDCDHDEHHAYIAGYTPGGFAFGITWEEYHREKLYDIFPLEDAPPAELFISDSEPTPAGYIPPLDDSELPF